MIGTLSLLVTLHARTDMYTHAHGHTHTHMHLCICICRFYPKLFAQADVEVVNTFSLLVTVPGTNSTVKPALIMCHREYHPQTMYIMYLS